MSAATPEELHAITQALADRGGEHEAFWADLADLALRCDRLTPQGRVNAFCRIVGEHHGPAEAQAAWLALNPVPGRS